MNTPRKPSQTEIESALRFDPLQAAEDITGELAKGSDATIALGMLFCQDHEEKKRELLKANNDSYYSMPKSEFRAIVDDLGFKVVLSEEFSSIDPWDNELEDEWFIATIPGALLWWDTYRGGESLNTAKLYYNWRCNEAEEKALRVVGSFISSGYITADNILVGNHDVREGLRHTLNKFLTNGEFVTPWIERPRLWLCEHAVKPPGYDEACDAKLQKFPQHVKDMIGPEKGS